jgi:hypothetical protein
MDGLDLKGGCFYNDLRLDLFYFTILLQRRFFGADIQVF